MWYSKLRLIQLVGLKPTSQVSTGIGVERGRQYHDLIKSSLAYLKPSSPAPQLSYLYPLYFPTRLPWPPSAISKFRQTVLS